jgi:hypothetical protein
MKKTTFLILTLLASILTFGQKETSEQTEMEKKLLKDNKVSDLTILTTEIVDNKPQIKQVKLLYKKYNKNGNITEYIPNYYKFSVAPSRWSFEYNNGNKITSTHYLLATGGGYKGKRTNQIEVITFTPNDPVKDTLITTMVYTYDENNNQISFIKYGYANEVDTKCKMNYDENKKMTRITSTYSLNPNPLITNFSYKYIGKLLTEKTTYGIDTINIISKIFYEYDKSDNLIKELEYEFNFTYWGDSILKHQQTISYDTYNHKIQETIIEYDTSKRKKKLLSKFSYKFNKYGNCTEKIELGKKDKIKHQSKWSYTYNSSGLIIEKHKLDKNGRLLTLWEYDYTHFE